MYVSMYDSCYVYQNSAGDCSSFWPIGSELETFHRNLYLVLKIKQLITDKYTVNCNLTLLVLKLLIKTLINF